MAQVIASTYEIIRKIGSGGGGTVYLANHLRLNKQVVVKAYKSKLSAKPEMLRREVDVLKNLNHPRIPRVYDFFAEGDTVYTVMDYVKGESLDRALDRGEHFSQAQVIEWGIQLLDALAYLHSPTHGTPPKGYVHSDIKPGNLMRLPDNSICLIDFNIALALGETNIVGRSAGYAPPEYYGVIYTESDETAPAGLPVTTPMSQRIPFITGRGRRRTTSLPGPRTSRSSRSVELMMIRPDVRSDIYSVGATLYHLLSGVCPSEKADETMPLSDRDFSPQVAAIINRAMRLDPNLRYQSAAEMLADLRGLRANDPMVRRRKLVRRIACAAFAVCFGTGIGCAFAGLKRMQTTDNWLKLAEYADNALQVGDTSAAIDYALQALPEQSGLLVPAPLPQAQRALADALGVYDLEDTYQAHGSVALPSAPLSVRIAPDGSTAAVICSGTLVVVDTDAAEILYQLPANGSALAEAEYLDADRLAFAGADGVQMLDLASGGILWTGGAGTTLAVSADGSTVAAIDRDEPLATLYDASSGRVKQTILFEGRRQRVVPNDTFANPNDSLLALNSDGSQIAVSFDDGSLLLFDQAGDWQTVLEPGDYTHFEGGFSGGYLAFSATNEEDSIFAVVESDTCQQTGGFRSEYAFHVQADEAGICLQTENLLVEIDPASGTQIPLVTTPKNIVAFASDGSHALIATADTFEFYDRSASQTASFDRMNTDFVQIAGDAALVADRNTAVLRLLRYESHPESTMFDYDPALAHDEARLSADGQRVMLFDYTGFTLFDRAGSQLAKVEIPEAMEVYDQQFRREGDISYLEVLYNDGTVRRYSAADGSLLAEQAADPPDPTLYEEFETDHYRVTSPLHGSPTLYDRATGREIAVLTEDAYLTYVTEVNGGLVVQYLTTDGSQYGQLLDSSGAVIADLPCLCDIWNGVLIFDYPTGSMRSTRIYSLQELTRMAREQQGGTVSIVQ